MNTHNWKPSPYTSPSGKLMYHCKWCGLYDPAPVKDEFEDRACVHDEYAPYFEVKDGVVRAVFC